MKLLALNRDEKNQNVTVKCSGKDVSVYSRCAYCKFCEGVQVGKRVITTPQKEKMTGIKKGRAPDEDLMNAAMMFNTLIRDGTDIVCNDEEGKGFTTMYGY